MAGVIAFENSFSVESKDENADVEIEVENEILFLHSYLLARYSPVFKCMLKNDYVEGQRKQIKLPEKKKEDIIEFFKFFYQDLEPELTPVTNFSMLFELCQQYQVDWLAGKLERHLLKMEGSERTVIVNFLLSEQFNLSQLYEKCSNFQFVRPFNEIAEFPEFAFLTDKAQTCIFKTCLVNFLKRDRDDEGNALVSFLHNVSSV